MMNKLRIEIVQLGKSKFNNEWKFLSKLRDKNDSKIFEIVDIKSISLPNTDNFWGYSDSVLSDLVKRSNSIDLTICFIDYPLEGNYFLRRLRDNVAVATFYETSEIFANANVSLNNYILLFIYISCTLYLLDIDDIECSFHDETRGCLFDTCGIKEDIIVSATNPQLCYECEAYLRKSPLPIDYIEQLKKEIKHIKKLLYFRMLDWIKLHPILSIVITTTFTILIGLLTSALYDLIRILFSIPTIP